MIIPSSKGGYVGWNNALHYRVLSYKNIFNKCTRIDILCQSLCHVRLFATPWTTACQASLSIEFSRQEYWSGLPFPPPEELRNPGIEPQSPLSQADSSLFELQGSLLSSLDIRQVLYNTCNNNNKRETTKNKGLLLFSHSV